MGLMIDSHCHLDFPAFSDARQELWQQCRDAGVSGCLVPAVNPANWQAVHDLTQQLSGVLPAYGTHPLFVEGYDLDNLTEQLDVWLCEHRAVAVGEIGLDFFYGRVNQAAQEQLCLGQMRVAVRRGLPVILHVRKAHDRMFALLARVPGVTGIVHSFSGSWQEAVKYLDRGFVLGFGGAVTYPRAHRLQQIFRQLPDHGFVLETDAPDQRPSMVAAGNNSPVNLPVIADFLAALRGVAPDLLTAQANANFLAVINAGS